jgi:hypothetical protein
VFKSKGEMEGGEVEGVIMMKYCRQIIANFSRMKSRKEPMKSPNLRVQNSRSYPGQLLVGHEPTEAIINGCN